MVAVQNGHLLRVETRAVVGESQPAIAVDEGERATRELLLPVLDRGRQLRCVFAHPPRRLVGEAPR